MTIEIPNEKWTDFFNDLSKRRFGWETKIEVLKEDIGDQIMSEGLPLNGIVFEEKSGKIEISVGERAKQHQTHNILNPTKVAFLGENETYRGVLEIGEENGAKTLISILNPMPVLVGYSSYQIVSV